MGKRGFLLLALWILPALSGRAASYTNTNSVEAERVLEKTAGRSPEKLRSDEERRDWARARLAWIALTRLQGRADQATKLFEGCGKLCEEFGPADEWTATKAWGCGRVPKAAPCGTNEEKKK